MEKIKVLITRILASSVNDLFVHFAKIAQVFLRGPSKLSFDKSPKPRYAPRYLTRVFLMVTPATVNFPSAEASKAIVLARLS